MQISRAANSSSCYASGRPFHQNYSSNCLFPINNIFSLVSFRWKSLSHKEFSSSYHHHQYHQHFVTIILIITKIITKITKMIKIIITPTSGADWLVIPRLQRQLLPPAPSTLLLESLFWSSWSSVDLSFWLSWSSHLCFRIIEHRWHCALLTLAQTFTDSHGNLPINDFDNIAGVPR